MPDTYPSFNFRLSREMKERLDETAERLGDSSGALVRRAVSRHLDEIDAEAEGDGAPATPSH